MPTDTPRTVILARGCGPLGRALASGLDVAGYDPVIVDRRTPVNGTTALRMDLTETDAVKRELFALVRSRGAIGGLVLLPDDTAEHPAGRHPWERAAIRGLEENTSLLRAAAPTLGIDGRVVLVPGRLHHVSATATSMSPTEAIIELGVAGVATELALPLVRCRLPAVTEVGVDEVTRQLLAAVTGPARRERVVEVAFVDEHTPHPRDGLQSDTAWRSAAGRHHADADGPRRRLSTGTSHLRSVD